MKKIISVILVCVMLISAVAMCFAAELVDGPITKNTDEEINKPDLKGLEYALSELFTDGRGLVSDEVFQETVYKLGLYEPIYSRPNGKSWIKFDITSYVGIYVKLNEGETLDNITAEELLERNGINCEYVDYTMKGLAEDNDNECRIIIGLNMTAIDKFDTDNMSNIDELYLLATLFNATGSKFTFTKLMRGGIAYSDTEIYHYDVNLDGEVSLADLKHFKAYLIGSRDTINLTAADRDGDGEITLKDYKKYKYYMLTN